ncbi:unnamed protein product [Coregonus sp. 'balchen']|nr:unnamed protein product [Coregonus sp. 'balchen']
MADYFNKNYYQEDINSPRDFKITIGKINESFSGFEQQDSQELLLFLMDGLHEDLNKVGRLESEQEKKEALFQGQFKSTVQCLTCHKKSRTFETFMTV